jgi:hypothetical protein
MIRAASSRLGLFLAAGLAAACAWGQSVPLLAEGFNAPAWPVGWTTQTLSVGIGSGHNPTGEVVDSSLYTNATPYEGSHFVRFNSWFARSNAQVRLASPAIDASASGELSVQFAWHQDSRTGKDNEGVTLQWSTNGETWHAAAPLTMRRGTPSEQWVLKRHRLPPEARSGTLRIAFHFLSQWGNNCYLDDVRVLDTPAIAAFPYEESFEDGFGAWAAGIGSDYPWTRHQGLTPSGAFPGQTTGPSGAHDGTYYVYVEASDPNIPSKTMTLEAPFDFSALYEPRLAFFSHLCGSAVGALHVEASTNGGLSWATEWSVSGARQANETDAWEAQHVDLAAYGGMADVRLRFRGVTDTGGLGDMAIDDVRVEETLYVPHAVCVDESAPLQAARVSAGAPIQKSWTLRNQGNSEWSRDAGVAFAFGGGDNPAAVDRLELDEEEVVLPGAERSFAIEFAAPTQRGIHAGFWSLRVGGTNFGERVWLHLAVDTPDVEIANFGREWVSDATTSATLAGQADPTAGGHLRWSNSLTGATGHVPATPSWAIPDVALGTGTNLLAVVASNAYGVARTSLVAVVRTPPGADTSGNGLPDWWEEQHFGGIAAANPAEDSDDDGANNADEYVAGTDPTDPESLFALTMVRAAPALPGTLVFEWSGVDGREYSIWMATNLSMSFSHVAGPIIPSGTAPMDYAHPAPQPAGAVFYRLGVALSGVE